MDKEITAALMFLRDMFNKQADDALLPVEEEFKKIKAKYHDAKILSNQLKKRAQKVQSLITLEMQVEHDKELEADDAWEFKTPSELEAEVKDTGALIDLLKKVN